MTKEELISNFDPNAPGKSGQLFGLPFSPEHADVVIIPIPWEVTVSYHTGTAKAPRAILEASSQVDLAVKEIPGAWKLGASMLPVADSLYEESSKLRELAAQHIRAVESGEKVPAGDPIVLKINEACENLNIYVKSATKKLIQEGKVPALLGGDHSIPLGFFRTLSEHYNRFGILQIDAHMDLRKAYEGFTYSHASIMYNALKLPAVGRLVQVGIRDYCDEELAVVKNAMGRVVTYFDYAIKDKLFEGTTWSSLCDEIIQHLPKDVYISFDIDGLNPKLCPATGTPVPGGFEFEQVMFLIKKVVKSGRRIIGFDLCEVSPGNDDWDANVGARLLYNLINWTGVSQGKLKTTEPTS
jgi:agmatinase